MFTKKIIRKIAERRLSLREARPLTLSLRGTKSRSNLMGSGQAPQSPIYKEGLPRTLRVLAMTVFAFLFFIPAFAYALSQDEVIDLAMGALEGPVFHKILMPYGTQEGAPLFPIYKQQPPAAQQDFRPPAPPPPVPIVVTPTPEPEPAPPPKCKTIPCPNDPKKTCVICE